MGQEVYNEQLTTKFVIFIYRMKNKQEKEFKTVEFQRKRRKELSDLYNSNPKEFWKQLETVRKKYRSKFKIKAKRTD